MAKRRSASRVAGGEYASMAAAMKARNKPLGTKNPLPLTEARAEVARQHRAVLDKIKAARALKAAGLKAPDIGRLEARRDRIEKRARHLYQQHAGRREAALTRQAQAGSTPVQAVVGEARAMQRAFSPPVRAGARLTGAAKAMRRAERMPSATPAQYQAKYEAVLSAAKQLNAREGSPMAKSDIETRLRGLKKAQLRAVAKDVGAQSGPRLTNEQLRASIQNRIVEQWHAGKKGSIAGQVRFHEPGVSNVDYAKVRADAAQSKAVMQARVQAAIDKVTPARAADISRLSVRGSGTRAQKLTAAQIVDRYVAALDAGTKPDEFKRSLKGISRAEGEAALRAIGSEPQKGGIAGQLARRLHGDTRTKGIDLALIARSTSVSTGVGPEKAAQTVRSGLAHHAEIWRGNLAAAGKGPTGASDPARAASAEVRGVAAPATDAKTRAAKRRQNYGSRTGRKVEIFSSDPSKPLTPYHTAQTKPAPEPAAKPPALAKVDTPRRAAAKAEFRKVLGREPRGLSIVGMQRRVSEFKAAASNPAIGRGPSLGQRAIGLVGRNANLIALGVAASEAVKVYNEDRDPDIGNKSRKDALIDAAKTAGPTVGLVAAPTIGKVAGKAGDMLLRIAGHSAELNAGFSGLAFNVATDGAGFLATGAFAGAGGALKLVELAGRVAGKLALPVALGFAAYEGYQGYQREGVKGAVKGVADSLTFGLASAAAEKVSDLIGFENEATLKKALEAQGKAAPGEGEKPSQTTVGTGLAATGVTLFGAGALSAKAGADILTKGVPGPLGKTKAGALITLGVAAAALGAGALKGGVNMIRGKAYLNPAAEKKAAEAPQPLAPMATVIAAAQLKRPDGMTEGYVRRSSTGMTVRVQGYRTPTRR